MKKDDEKMVNNQVGVHSSHEKNKAKVNNKQNEEKEDEEGKEARQGAAQL